MRAARSGDGRRLQALLAAAPDPLTEKVALWALADAAPDYLTWSQADAARRDLGDWPRPSRRQAAAEKLISQSGLPPRAIIAWFGGQTPQTPQGAMALATALRADGQTQASAAIIRHEWRAASFDAVTQQLMRSQFSDVLTPTDDIAREDYLLYGAASQDALDLLPMLPPDRQAVARVRLAMRQGAPDTNALLQALPVAEQTDPGIVYEEILALEAKADASGALALIGNLPESLPSEAAAERIWRHGWLVVQALEMGDAAQAYRAATHGVAMSGLAAAEAQFYAGWIALSRLKDPGRADRHFTALEALSQSPITQARALYWRGRVADAQGDPVGAQLFYGQAAQFQTTFYGQLGAARAGLTKVVLNQDPVINPADQAAFEARDVIRVARLLASQGDHEGFRTFVSGLSQVVDNPKDEAQVVDLVLGQGDQELAMRVVRNSAKRGVILTGRGYPVQNALPNGSIGADQALVLSVTRQESSFDPRAHSGAGAVGMMQLLPSTAKIVARRSGLGAGRLDDPDYNMRVGSAYLSQLVDQFSGSYLLAAAAYNAGPGRPTQWTGLCGDPRSSDTDPLDFIECIPFSETRDYVMRVLEATQVYRARLNGGTAPLTLAADLKRGAYMYRPTPIVQDSTIGTANDVVPPLKSVDAR